MECDTQSNSLTVHQAMQLRRQAADLLNRLITDREQSERRMAETGKRDPMKFITGRTAFDAAIASARELIANMDNLLGRLNGTLEVKPADALPQVHTLRFQPKTSARNGKAAAAMNGSATLLLTASHEADRLAAPVSATISP
jgi:hypothetical protein